GRGIRASGLFPARHHGTRESSYRRGTPRCLRPGRREGAAAAGIAGLPLAVCAQHAARGRRGAGGRSAPQRAGAGRGREVGGVRHGRFADAGGADAGGNRMEAMTKSISRKRDKAKGAKGSALDSTLAQLEALGNDKVRALNIRNGAGENQFGVRLGDIRKLAARIKSDDQLALGLWATGNLDARLLAILLLEPDTLSVST